MSPRTAEEGGLRGKREYMCRQPPWRVSSGSHRLSTNTEGMSPLAGWRTMGTNGRTVGNLDCACEEQTCADLLPEGGWGEGTLGLLVAMFLATPPASLACAK